MHGKPKYQESFTHLDYVNPDAPKGGTIRFGSYGSFDNLNRVAFKGSRAAGLGYINDTLMRRVWDEAFTMYGLIAEFVEMPADRSSITFHINPNARFHDGSPITREDVLFSLETFQTKGTPNQKKTYGKVIETRLIEEIVKRRREQYELEKNAAYEIRQKDLETEVKILNLDKESEYARLEKQRQVDMKRAQEKTAIIKEQSERQKDAEEAQIISEQEIKNAKIAQQRNIDSHRIETEREVRLLDIDKAKRLSIEEHQKNLEILNKSKQVLKSKAEEERTREKAIEAEEKANSAKYVEKAQGIKKVDVITAASKAEQDKYATMAAKLRYEIDAAGKEALNTAENLRSDASRRSALRLKLAEKIEAIIRESVKPMANIGDIKIVDVNGLPGFSGTSGSGGSGETITAGGSGRSGNLADNVVSSALRYRAHQPFLDSLLKEIGMNPGEISNIRNILGDYENPKKDFHMNFDKDPTKGTKGSK